MLPYTAGIDIGSKFHIVALDSKNKDVKEFEIIYTGHVYEIANYLKDNYIQTVAMTLHYLKACSGYLHFAISCSISIALRVFSPTFWTCSVKDPTDQFITH